MANTKARDAPTSELSLGLNSGPPPSYNDHVDQRQRQQDLPEDLGSRLLNLDLAATDSDPTTLLRVVTPDRCVAHLKFLEAVAQLREEVGNTEGLFGIASPEEPAPPTATADHAPSPQGLGHIKVREKRWAVFVARAVERFQRWWECCVPATLRASPRSMLTCKTLGDKGILDLPAQGSPIVQLGSKDHLPPLDVLMVWHSYMLNPRCFLEDCLRHGKMDFYATPFPWPAISESIDSVTFEFNATPAAIANFESATRHNWGNLEDTNYKTLICRNCGRNMSVLWTNGSQWVAEISDMSEGYGFADSYFWASCEYCKLRVTHDYLRAQKFREDVQLLIRNDLPMPGTILNRCGEPDAKSSWISAQDSSFPNALLKAGLDKQVLAATDPSNSQVSMEQVKQLFEIAIRNKTSGAAGRHAALPKERVSIRRCMSRYWFNSSSFALDLVGAVVRQGSFIEKMHNIDWLHSPALFSTMERLLIKYERFFAIMASHPRNTAVPTLDVDLAWHTHQLNAQAYYIYSDHMTGTLIDHDDKIEETKLSTSFAWTSKIYQEKYGEAYSSCTCWYCEAVRESHTSTLDKLFKPNKSKALANLHASADDITSDPLRSPHISAHNAVRDNSAEAQVRARVKAAELDRAFQKACARARKQKRKEPVRDEYFYGYAWGVPYAYPMLFPYAVPVGIGVGNPGSCGAAAGVDSTPGVYGNCAAGTCGGMAAFGGSACAGVGGNCGGGGAGGCGGGGGGCGGGGGGGCGGGGGG